MYSSSLILQKTNQKGSDDFDVKNSLWKSIFCTFGQGAKLGKASWDAYNPKGWLISLDLLKNWVAEGVPSKVNDFT